jgi:hypothetical protein
MVSSGMLRPVALERNEVSEELSASIFRVTRIGELRTTLAATILCRLKALLISMSRTVTWWSLEVLANF